MVNEYKYHDVLFHTNCPQPGEIAAWFCHTGCSATKCFVAPSEYYILLIRVPFYSHGSTLVPAFITPNIKCGTLVPFQSLKTTLQPLTFGSGLAI